MTKCNLSYINAGGLVINRTTQEHKLMFMLGEFSPKLGADYVKKVRSCIDCNSLKKNVSPKVITSNRTGKPIAFRIDLKNPNYFAFSHPLTRFKKGEDYHIGNEETNFCTKLGMIPAFQ